MLIPISNAPREYAWGSPTLIPALQDREPTGRPEAEIWYGDHPGCPSRTPDGSTLDRVLADGGRPPLPYLLKVLAAGMSLSIQAHPSRAEAEEGFAREEEAGIPRDADTRTYRDANHKPEIIVALSDRFLALVGLRPLEATRTLLAGLGDADGVVELRRRLAGDDHAAALRDVLGWVLSGEGAQTVADVVAALATAEDPAFAAEIDVLRRIAADFPGDPGVVVALLMNLVRLSRGEALFAPAGVLHAYQEGIGVELMAASDNVLRGGLTPKHVDVPELLRIVDTTPGPAPLVRPESADGVDRYDVDVPDFALRRAVVSEGVVREIPVSGPAVTLVTRGEVEVAGVSGQVTLRAGDAVFATAEEGPLRLSGDGDAFIAEPGR